MLEGVDFVGLKDTFIVDHLTIDAIYPKVDFIQPIMNDTLGIGDVVSISWVDSSSLGSEISTLKYRIDDGWIEIAVLDAGIYNYNWLVPNNPTSDLKLKIIAENIFGYRIVRRFRV